jgi:LysM repeat protein
VAAEATEKPVIVETLAGNTTQAKDETDETTDGRDDTENTDTSTKTDGEEKMTEGTKETEADKKETEGTKETEEAKEAEADKKEPEETKDTKDEEKTTEVAREVTYYTVQNGDTLATISLEKYHTLDMIDQIQKLNAIDDKDKIYAGEKILLP